MATARSGSSPAPADSTTVRPNAILQQAHPTLAGTSLSELKTLATRVGLAYEMAMRPAGADFLVPSVIHWRVDHYSAVVRKEGNRYLLLDPIFGGRRWVSAAMLNDEASGYVLAPTAMLGPEWRRVSGLRSCECHWPLLSWWSGR
jgi:ABC-type bacteriocin/lantibiotic exporter with double-glycine peptidase domain